MSGYQEKKKKKERDEHYVFIYLTALRSQQGKTEKKRRFVSDTSNLRGGNSSYRSVIATVAAQCLRPAPAVVAGTGK